MKTPSLFAAVAALLWLAACDSKSVPDTPGGANEAPSREVPRRKPGLWKQTILIEELNSLQTGNLCLDAKADAALSWWSQQGVRQKCSRNDLSRQTDGSWRFASVCDGGGGTRTTSEGSVVGDFNRKYQLKSEVTTVNSPVPQLNGTRKITIDAEWLGECPKSMRPGELELPDGRRVNLMDLSGIGR